jgi:hydrogenase nickel incorporation protein HypA/HybF
VHEVSLVEALFDQADRAIAPRAPAAVRKVTVRIGELAGVDEQLFRTAFDGCKTDRGYTEASLEIIGEAAVWICGACRGAIPAGAVLRCAACDGTARLDAGGDLILQRLELEVHDV